MVINLFVTEFCGCDLFVPCMCSVEPHTICQFQLGQDMHLSHLQFLLCFHTGVAKVT